MASNNSRRNRTVLEIIAQILGACHNRAGKTALMYHCNMNFKQLTGYLDLMQGAKLLLIENNGPHFFFRVSSKGKDFLRVYQSLKTLME